MNETLIILVLAYVFCLALLGLFLIASTVKIWIKITLVIAVVIFYFFSYQGWKQAQGWAAQVSLPEKFLLHYAVIEEPDKKMNEQGSIYLWLSDLAEDKLAEQPRAYRIKYDQQTHVKVAKAMKKIQGGELQMATTLSKKKKFKKHIKTAKNIGSNNTLLEFSGLPDPSLPEK